MPIALIAISKATALQVQSQILGCEQCADEAEIPLCWLLDDATGRDGTTTDYLLSEAAKCPKCMGEVSEKTLVEWCNSSYHLPSSLDSVPARP